MVELTERQRLQAMKRWAVLRPHIEDGVPLSRVAADAGVALRSTERWLARYRDGGLVGLARSSRADRGERRLPEPLVGLIEGLVLQKPAPSLATVHRMVCSVAAAQGWPKPSYASVRGIAGALDPAAVTLAQQGDKAYRQGYDLVYRRQAERPNAIWQADHTELDIRVVDAGTPARPWLSVVIDDYSRAVPHCCGRPLASGRLRSGGAPCALG